MNFHSVLLLPFFRGLRLSQSTGDQPEVGAVHGVGKHGPPLPPPACCRHCWGRARYVAHRRCRQGGGRGGDIEQLWVSPARQHWIQF